MDILYKSSNGRLYTIISEEVFNRKSALPVFCKFRTFFIKGHLKSYAGYC